jgi:CRP-like cAMP-binding protein
VKVEDALGPGAEEDVAAVLRIRLLSGCTEEAIRSLAAAMQTVPLADGQVLVRQGEIGDCLYLVIEGRLRVSATTRREEARFLYELAAGDTFGEMALMADQTSAVEVRVLDHATVAKLTASDFHRFVDRHPAAAFQLTEAISKGLGRHRLAAALHLGRQFQSLDAAALRDLESELELMTLYAGEVLYRQGEPGDFMCLVISGRLRVVATGVNHTEFPVAELGSGETVGEMALMSGEARSATVYAIRDTQLARLSKAGMLRFLTRHPEAAFQMVTRPLVSRLKRMTTGEWREPSTVATIALIPVSKDISLEPFSSGLIKALSTYGPAVRVNSRIVDEHLGKKGISQTWERQGRNVRVAEWLNELEAESRYVVYEAESHPSPWTERCIRQADRVPRTNWESNSISEERFSALERFGSGRPSEIRGSIQMRFGLFPDTSVWFFCTGFFPKETTLNVDPDSQDANVSRCILDCPYTGRWCIRRRRLAGDRSVTEPLVRSVLKSGEPSLTVGLFNGGPTWAHRPFLLMKGAHFSPHMARTGTLKTAHQEGSF